MPVQKIHIGLIKMDRIMILLGLTFCLFMLVESKGCYNNNRRLCCTGKNNTCISQGRTMRGRTGICYCDTSCKATGDCCDDYNYACTIRPRAVHCYVSPWGKWSKCSSDCGSGEQNRTRKILRQPSNGGKECPITDEKRVCSGINCISTFRADTGLAKETGRIVAARFGVWRSSKTYDIKADIRKNLYNRYHINRVEQQEPYCAYYKVTDSRPWCKRRGYQNWAAYLRKHQTICVECQPTAMKHRASGGNRCRGHGMLNSITKWKAFGVSGCHGTWMRQTNPRKCRCNVRNTNSFVFI